MLFILFSFHTYRASLMDHKRQNVMLLTFMIVVIDQCMSEFVNNCTTRDACKCYLPNKHVINLNSVGLTNGLPRFSDVKDKDGNLYYFNPCHPFTSKVSPNTCKKCALCVRDSLKQYATLGTQRSDIFMYDTKKQSFVLRYFKPGSPSVQTIVYLVCSKTTNLLAEGRVNNSTYVLQLFTPCACPDGCHGNTMSVGTWLVIAFVSLVLTYLVVGILYNKAVSNQSGCDVFPNKRSWGKLLSLMRDGWLFFLSPCTGHTVTYQTYESV